VIDELFEYNEIKEALKSKVNFETMKNELCEHNHNGFIFAQNYFDKKYPCKILIINIVAVGCVKSSSKE
jgi:hypothetical protein